MAYKLLLDRTEAYLSSVVTAAILAGVDPPEMGAGQQLLDDYLEAEPTRADAALEAWRIAVGLREEV